MLLNKLRNWKTRLRVGNYLFVLFPFFIVILFMTSGEPIIPLLVGTSIASALYALSFPNTIAFNLAIGLISGTFVYYLTAYLPEKRREKIEIVITKRLLNQIFERIYSIFSTIKSNTSKIDKDIDAMNQIDFEEMCEKTLLNQPTGSKKIIQEYPLILGDVILRESILNDWRIVLTYLNEIDNASSFVSPEIYDFCLKLRKSRISFTVNELARTISNTNLKAWSGELFELFKNMKTLNGIIVEIEER